MLSNIDGQVAMLNASSVRVDGKWYNVLGYDINDDVVCLENYAGDDITIINASTSLNTCDVRVEVNLREALDLLFLS